jgi:hypothetical protein
LEDALLPVYVVVVVVVVVVFTAVNNPIQE